MVVVVFVGKGLVMVKICSGDGGGALCSSFRSKLYDTILKRSKRREDQSASNECFFWYCETLSFLTSTASKCQRQGQSGSNEGFFRLTTQKKGQTTTGVIKQLKESLVKINELGRRVLEKYDPNLNSSPDPFGL